MPTTPGTDMADNAPSSTQRTPERVFWRQGDVWLVGYEGETKHIKDMDGMSYIAYLLSKPGDEIRAVELYRLLGTAGSSSNTNRVQAREAVEAGLRVSGPIPRFRAHRPPHEAPGARAAH